MKVGDIITLFGAPEKANFCRDARVDQNGSLTTSMIGRLYYSGGESVVWFYDPYALYGTRLNPNMTVLAIDYFVQSEPTFNAAPVYQGIFAEEVCAASS